MVISSGLIKKKKRREIQIKRGNGRIRDVRQLRLKGEEKDRKKFQILLKKKTKKQKTQLLKV